MTSLEEELEWECYLRPQLQSSWKPQLSDTNWYLRRYQKQPVIYRTQLVNSRRDW